MGLTPAERKLLRDREKEKKKIKRAKEKGKFFNVHLSDNWLIGRSN